MKIIPKMRSNLFKYLSNYYSMIQPQGIQWNDDVSVPFMQSIKEVIPHAVLLNKQVRLFAKKIEPLQRCDDINCLAECISKQILYMEKRGITLIGFEMSDIVSINEGQYYVAINYERVMPYSDGMIRFLVPFVKPTFTAVQVQRLPASVSYLTGRYSLGCLLLALMDVSLNSIRYTKLYWFIKRCIETPGIGFYLV